MPIRRVISLVICITAFTAGYARMLNDSIPVDTVMLDDGTLYMGQIQDSLFNGQGRCIYADGTVYEGEWKDGLWHGQGIVVYPDGDIYKGSFQNHVKQGNGTYMYASGARYDGQWKDDRFNGNGRLLFEDGGIYDGAWKDDMKHGYGKLTSSQGRSTTGYFYNDEYLGMPFDTEIVPDSTLTDELKAWGFKQQEHMAIPYVAIGASYGFKGMVTGSIWFEYPKHFFWGISLGYNIDPPTRGINSGMGFQIYSTDIHTTGNYISSVFLVDGGIIIKKISLGGAFGMGLNCEYMNCKANNNSELYNTYYGLKYGDSYFRKSSAGIKVVYRGYAKYPIYIKKQPKAHVYLGYGNADGLFLGLGTYL